MGTEEQDQDDPGRGNPAVDPDSASPDQDEQDRRHAAGGDPNRGTDRPDDTDDVEPDDTDDDESVEPTRPGDKDRERGASGA